MRGRWKLRQSIGRKFDRSTADELAGPVSPARPEPSPAPPRIRVPPTDGARFPRATGPRRRGPLLAILLVLIAGGLGAAPILVRVGGARDAGYVLNAVHARVGASSSFRFSMDGEEHRTAGGDEPGGETTRLNGEGEWTPDRWRIVTKAYGSAETIMDGLTVYDRSIDGGDDLVREQWTRWEGEPMSHATLADELAEMGEIADEDDELEEEDSGSTVVAVALGIYLGDPERAVSGGFTGGGTFEGDEAGVVANPNGFLAAIRGIADPTVVAQDGDMLTLGGKLRTPGHLAQAFGRPIPDGSVQLTVGPEDLPRMLRLDVASGDSSVAVEVRFRDWGSPIEIGLPSRDDVDETPWLDEDKVRETATGLGLLWPTAIPKGWELTDVGTRPAVAVVGEPVTGCDAVSIGWNETLPDEAPDEAREDGGYLHVDLLPAGCIPNGDATPDEPIGPTGVPTRAVDAEVEVGKTLIRATSSLSAQDLEAVLASLAPIDVESLIAAGSVQPRDL